MMALGIDRESAPCTNLPTSIPQWKDPTHNRPRSVYCFHRTENHVGMFFLGPKLEMWEAWNK